MGSATSAATTALSAVAQARRPARRDGRSRRHGRTARFTAAHERFWQRARRKHGDPGGTRALIEVLLLHRRLPFIAVHAALDAVERVGSTDPALVAIEARRIADGRREAAVVERPALRRFDPGAAAGACYSGCSGLCPPSRLNRNYPLRRGPGR